MNNLSILKPEIDEPSRGFYLPRDAARIARVPRHRLDAWRREGIVAPTLRVTDDDGEDSDGYTFEALVYLRLLRMLRESEIPLQHAVEGIRSLRQRFGPPSAIWGEVRLLIQGGQVFAYHEDELTTATRRPRAEANQGAWGDVLFGPDFRRMSQRVDALLVPDKFREFVEIDPEARSGAPVILGTTIRTALIQRLDELKFSAKRIQESYPHLTFQQIRGALRFERFLDAEAA